MSRLITRKSRLNASLVLLASIILIFAGIALTHWTAPLPSWTENMAIILQVIAAVGIIAVAHLLQRMPTTFELVTIARQALKEDERALKAWESIRFVRQNFRDMPARTKIGYVSTITVGVALALYGLVDAFGLIPLLKLHRATGEVFLVPRWVMVGMEWTMAYVALLLSQLMFRERMFDEWDEALKKFMKDSGIT